MTQQDQPARVHSSDPAEGGQQASLAATGSARRAYRDQRKIDRSHTSTYPVCPGGALAEVSWPALFGWPRGVTGMLSFTFR